MGAQKPPAWYTNLLANQTVVVERRGANGHLERVETTAVVTESAERERIAASCPPPAPGDRSRFEKWIDVVR